MLLGLLVILLKGHELVRPAKSGTARENTYVIGVGGGPERDPGSGSAQSTLELAQASQLWHHLVLVGGGSDGPNRSKTELRHRWVIEDDDVEEALKLG
mmetsp:Transcript_4518/g.9852  ORF Transcript_4518/g.9852 Transcript_4518/m.9852 type:complete len:98 (+) Transcript_4518:155-448(+)